MSLLLKISVTVAIFTVLIVHTSQYSTNTTEDVAESGTCEADSCPVRSESGKQVIDLSLGGYDSLS